MNIVVQEDEMGCGVACVASILGITYQEALMLHPDGKRKAKTSGFSPKNLVLMLENAGKKYKTHYIKILNPYVPSTSIVYIKRCKKFPYAHYILKTEEGWMNPWANLPYEPRKAKILKRAPGKPTYVIQACNET